MIHYLKRKHIDIVKYNACIEAAINSRIYAYSWYLDIVADNWDALVLNDYEAVMPLPWRQKYFIKYVYTPYWLLQLGVFFTNEKTDINLFLQMLDKKFKFVDLRMNTGNKLEDCFLASHQLNQMQFISLNNRSYESIKSQYSRNRKRDLQKAANNELTVRWDEDPTLLIELFKNNVGTRLSKVRDVDYLNLTKLLKKILKLGKGEMLCVYDNKENLVASAFFLKHKHRVTELVCSTDFKNRDNGANTFLNDGAISKYHPNFEIFNFGGSTMKNISNYYKSFNAESEHYNMLKFNNLPFPLKLFKR